LCYSTGAPAAVNQLQWPLFAGGRRHFAKGAGNEASRSGVWCASSYSTTSFAFVGTNGAPANYNATNAFVAAPGFLLS
ncbi:MAG: hypothetical protein IKG87_02855, partial [Clostridia bacterium]|nr:hypothetical protein [Clostridia bacterium]